MIRAAFTVLCLLTAPVGAQRPYTISGVIVQANTRQPLNRAEVSISEVLHPETSVSFVTAADGRFTFPGLAAGKYSLAARWRGTSELLHGSEQFSTAIVAGPNLDSEHVLFPFIVPGTVSVSVVDGEDDPVRNAQVMLFRKRVVFGWLRTVLVEQANTNSSGVCRFAHRAPGEFFVAVQARPWYADGIPQAQGGQDPQTPAHSQLDVAYPVTYSGDTLDPEAASPIRISQGDSVDVNVTLRAVPAVRLEFKEPTPSAHGQDFQTQPFVPDLTQVGPGGSIFQLPAVQRYGVEDGQVIAGLAPGRYLVSLAGFTNGAPGSQASSLGIQVLDIEADTTLNAAELVKTIITSKVRLEGAEPSHVPPSVQMASLDSDQQVMLGQHDRSNQGDGVIRPGRYVLQLPYLSEFYIKAVSVKGAEYADGIISIQPGASAQVSVTLASGTTKIDGVALKDGKPFGGAMVLLIPDSFSRSRYVARDQSDSDGTFTLPNVSPGRYTAIAIDDGRDLAYQDHATIKPYLTLGQVVVVPGSAPALQVNVLHRLP